MLIIFLPSFVSSQFVPFVFKEYSESVSLPVVNKTELEELVNKSIKVFAMGFSRRNQRYNGMLKAYHEFAHHFSSEAVFVIYEHDQAKAHAAKLGMNLPIIFYYNNKKLITTYPYIDNEISFIKILNLILNPENTQIALTKNDLYSIIGDLNFAILAPTQEKFELSLKLHENVSSSFGEVDVIKISPELLIELGFDSKSTVLFRKEDSCIVPLKTGSKNFNDDVHSFYDASKPVYKLYQGADFINEDFQMFFLTSPKLTDEMRDFLYEIALVYLQYNFGWLKSEYLPIGQHMTQNTFENKLGMHFGNVARRWYVDLEDIFTYEFIRQPFDKKKWTQRTEKAIQVIENGRKRIYVSEPIPQSTPGSLIKKIVGLSYKDFINDPDHDILMLYITSNNTLWRDFKPSYINFVKEFNRTGKTFLKFGWIYLDRNSSEEPFPYIPSIPHLELFPAKNKSKHEMIRGGKSRDNIVRFLKNKCLEEFPLEAPEADKVQTAFNLINMLMNLPYQMPETEIEKLMQYVSDTSESIGIDLSSVPGFDKYANKLSAAQKQAVDEAKMNSASEAAQLKKESNKVQKQLDNENDTKPLNEL